MDLQAPAYLKIKKVVGSEVLEAALEAGFVGSQKEELQPEAVGMQDLIFVLILQISDFSSWNAAGVITYSEELFVQTRDFGLEGTGTSLLGKR